jgi:predicted acyl esterase
MTVGWFDAEDLYSFKYLPNNRETSKNYNTIVMGPWSHGDWARNGAKLLLET